MASQAFISPEVLRWARKRASAPVDALASALKTDRAKVEAWEDGSARPTFRQAERIAAFYHIPFGYLFLPEPPQEQPPIPDLRTQDGAPRDGFSPDVMDLLRDVTLQHDWYRDYLADHGAKPRPFVGRFDARTPVGTVAADIRSVVGIDPDEPPNGTWEQHLTALFDRCEEAGIWVMRSGYVGTSTRRTLSVGEFRGFAIADKIAPLIFINGRDAKAAQFFTLAHELAHLWLGASGVSDPFLGRDDAHAAGIERRCNAIAAEVLVPRDRFLALWTDRAGLDRNADALAQRFKVSRVVIARRALDVGKIGWDEHSAFFERERQGWQTERESGGGDFYRTSRVRNGKRFTRAVVNNAMSGNLLFSDAGALLHMKPTVVRDLGALRV